MGQGVSFPEKVNDLLVKLVGELVLGEIRSGGGLVLGNEQA